MAAQAGAASPTPASVRQMCQRDVCVAAAAVGQMVPYSTANGLRDDVEHGEARSSEETVNRSEFTRSVQVVKVKTESMAEIWTLFPLYTLDCQYLLNFFNKAKLLY